MNSPFNNQNPMNGSPSPFEYSSQPMTVAESSVDVRLDFIRKTYSLFLAGILMALVAGTICLNSAPVFNAAISVLRSPLLSIALLFGLAMGAQAVSRIEGLNYAALFGFTAFMGFLFAPVLAMYESRVPGIVSQAAILTFIAFGSLTAYAFISKKDFSFMGGMLTVGLIMLIAGGLANVFLFKSSGASYWMAWVTLLLFSGYVLYDTSQIIHRYDAKGYVAAALALFIDFFNMFMAILRILGGRR
ncbi:MAG: Bax inhibitor-1 family protein [Armatimonadetes bacterium]|nr:Bax inhibitor-1 family protein [Armatimonadota bacterium]